MPESETEKFFADFSSEGSRRVNEALGPIGTLWSWYPAFAFLGFASDARRFERRIVVDFLLSTNFFRSEGVRDGLAPIKYTGWHERSLACSNPFVRY